MWLFIRYSPDIYRTLLASEPAPDRGTKAVNETLCAHGFTFACGRPSVN